MSSEKKSRKQVSDSSSEYSSDESSSSDDSPRPKAKQKAAATRKSTDSKRKPPGRPRKQPATVIPEIKGIVDAPTDSTNVFELSFHTPNILKKIAQLSKAMNVTFLQIVMRKTKLIVFLQDTYCANNVAIVFDGHKMIRYYCKEEMELAISQANFMQICDSINKKYDSFGIHRSSVDIHTLSFVFNNQQTGVISSKQVRTSVGSLQQESDSKSNKKGSKKNMDTGYPKLTPELFEAMLSDDYQLFIQYPTFDFKKLISANKSATLMHFRQDGKNSPFYLEADKSNKSVQSRDIIIKDKVKINFDSRIDETYLFRISVPIRFLKAIGTNALSKDIELRLSEGRPVSSRMSTENGAIIAYALTKQNENNLKVSKTTVRTPNDDSDSDESSDDEDVDEPKKVGLTKPNVDISSDED